jgi:hypothetical protein
MSNLENQANIVVQATAAAGRHVGNVLLNKQPGKRGGTSKTKSARKAERKARRGNRK